MKIQAAFSDLQWNRHNMARRALELIRCEYADDILPAPPQPITADPVSENFAAVSKGVPLQADPQHDHIAHLQEHVRFILDPMFGAGPAIPGPALQGILAHCNQHLMFLYSAVIAPVVQANAQAMGLSDAVIAQSAQQAGQMLQQQMPQLPQMLEQAAQVVQGKMPKPPVDPAVEKTFEAAMAEIERKKQVDMQNAHLEQAKLASNQQFEAMQMQQDAQLSEAKNFMDLQIASAREQAQRMKDELSAQVEMMKNAQDNEQHQMTELLKNLQDNQTHLQIAMEQGLSDIRNTVPETPDMSPVVEQLNAMLGQVEKQKSQDSLVSVMSGLQAVIESLNRPKMIVEDANGKPIGIQ